MTPQDPLAERYGRGRSQRGRWVVVASGIVGVVALTWLLWVIWFESTPAAQSQLQGYDVVSGELATAQVTVTLADPDVEASCLVRASAADSSVVGERSFQVTGVEGPQRLEVEVRTEREATSVEMVGCTAPGQSRPR
ncbi:DUF4307 domain-containing protein [Nocardioides aequoreus]|uniref:DUF4307 domain-containing protein n=1 Tax=Nocardioides aequoreus TaxID=397278 RepID=UPI0014700970|nr:DUF4307 domain-containing protein [Nocardioides aequoreus]